MTRITEVEPRRLAFGLATASYQVEGAVDADGRGRSIWDVLCDRPGAIKDSSSGAVACDSYHRLDDDLALLAEAGVDFYRFSIAWPRIQPQGHGPALDAGLDYYDRLVDGLLERGITPMATLYHWDLPQPLEDEGGWANRDTAARLAEYAQVVHERLGNRVKTWATLNEPWCSAFLGYAAGIHAPGRQEPDAAYAAAHHLLLGHALAARAIREADSAADVGIVLNLNPVYLDAPGAEDARDGIDAIQNGLWLGALVDGRYPEELRRATGVLWNPDVVREGDLAAIQGSLDWLGVNFYTPARIAPPREGADAAAVGQATAAYPGVPACSFAPREPKTEMGWEIDPHAFEELLVDVSKRAAGLPLAVTENGAAFADGTRAGDGSVDDQDRIRYLTDHIAAVRRARDAGADVRAYVAWTLLDNFEWAEGYTKKFGLVEIEDGSLRRVPKASFRWFAQQVRDEREGHTAPDQS